MRVVSRRVVLGLLSTAGAVAVGVLWANRPEALVKKILAARFPGVVIAPAGIAVVTRDLKQARFQQLDRRIALEIGAWAAGVATARHVEIASNDGYLLVLDAKGN
jgi:hypothetical protein